MATKYRSSRRIEATIQKEAVRKIREKYPFLLIHATLNELARNHVDMGIDVGIPDLLLMGRNDNLLHVFFLEIKTKTGKMRDTQIEWADKYAMTLCATNTCYGVAYGYLELLELVDKWVADNFTKKDLPL